jgi:hypothetical protein
MIIVFTKRCDYREYRYFAKAGATEANSETMEGHPGTMRLTLEQWRFTLEPRKFIMETKSWSRGRTIEL